MNDPEAALKAGRPAEALELLQEQVKRQPADARKRAFLFQLLCVLGEWERAQTQLKVLTDLDSEAFMLAAMYEKVIACEKVRADVFAGKRAPTIVGKPEEWMGSLVHAVQLLGQGQFEAAAKARDQALDAAPEIPGSLDGESFEWIMDADTRFGPMLETFIEGQYFWVPFARIKQITIQAPSDLRDLLWVPAQFIWSNEGQAVGFIPVRYPGTERSNDGPAQLSRQTDWQKQEHGHAFGVGARILFTEKADKALLDIRQVDFNLESAGQ